ncbi:hypothetical protein Q9L58_002476 [Maublancomyces gigas]|uniref:RlpA-like protein double-psi beta-barrel domain-containing protein n=1 Tax=Discina gigas TaxID=1032678 RepID=A0ABR3GRJ1_9PEZI
MKFSAAALGFMLAFNGVLAAPIIKERAIEIVTIVQTVTEVVHTTSTVLVPAVPTETPASVPSAAIQETPSAVAQLVAVTPTPYYAPSASESATSVEPTSALPTPLPPISIPSTTVPIPVSTILPTPTPIVVPTPTSIVVPTPTPIVVPTPTSIAVPTTTYVPPVATLAAPAPAPAPAPPTSAPQAFANTGSATFYDVGLGSCGLESIPSDYVIALSWARMDATYNANPNKNIQCGKKIRCQQVVTPTNPNPPVITVTIVDRCPGCDANNLDFSRGAYQAMGCTEFQGVCPFTWSFI